MEKEVIVKIEGDCDGARNTINSIDEYLDSIPQAIKSANDAALMLFYVTMRLSGALAERLPISPTKAANLAAFLLDISRIMPLSEFKKIGKLAHEDVQKNGKNGIDNVTSMNILRRCFPENISPCSSHPEGGCLKVSFTEPDVVSPQA